MLLVDRLGVAIENWVEDEYSRMAKQARDDSLLKSQGVGFNEATTNSLSFSGEVSTEPVARGCAFTARGCEFTARGLDFTAPLSIRCALSR